MTCHVVKKHSTCLFFAVDDTSSSLSGKDAGIFDLILKDDICIYCTIPEFVTLEL